MSEDDHIKRTRSGPVTPPRIAGELRTLGVTRGDKLLIHTSLSKIGWVPGGAQGVIEALLAAVGREGLIVMPAFTMHLSDPANWRAPPLPLAWHEETRATMPAFDPHLSQTRKMGVINEAFRSMAGVVRGTHPQSSFAAWGTGAQNIVSPHKLEHALDEQSPLGRLYAAGAKVLLLGTRYENCTSFHLAEHHSGKLPKVTRNGAPMLVNGERRWVAFEGPDYQGEDFEALGAAFEAASPAVSIGKVGEATCRLFPMCAAVDFATEWLKANRP